MLRLSKKRFMPRPGVTEKLWISMVALVIVIMLPVSIALDRGVRSFYFRYITNDLVETGTRFAEFLARASDPESSTAIRAIAEISGTPLLVIDGKGVVVTSSSRLADEIGKQLVNPRILGALTGELSVFHTTDQTLPGSLFVTAVPVKSRDGSGDVTGAVVLFRSADGVEYTMLAIRWVTTIASAALLILFSGLAWFLSRRLVQPLLEMKDVAHAMAEGDYEVTVTTEGSDELAELGEAINHLGASLDAHDRGRREFFANVSHELRTPLSYVQGYADALADGLAESPEEVAKYGRILAEESRRLSRLVDDLFELARAEEGHLSLRPERFDLNEVIERTVDRMSVKAKKKEIRLRSSTREYMLVHADPSRVEQIMINLLDNALRHTPRDGEITISAEPKIDPVGHRHISVRVEDSGAGFDLAPGESFQTVFERFYRGEKSRNRDHGGSGMGLAIVKAIVEAGGGNVSAGRSPALGGGMVTFTLPIA